MVYKTTEKGQALIMISLTAIGLFGFAALAIDGSVVFSDRRHAQNAADTAVLGAALSKIRGGDWEADGLNRAQSNGYDDDGITNDVLFYDPPIDGPYQGNNEYIEVKITSHVKTKFARIIGRSEVINQVEALARATSSVIAPMYSGNAIVALNKTECSALNYQGGARLKVNGSGMFSNSGCTDTSNGSFNTNTGSGTVDTPCLTAVGSITKGTNTTLIDHGCLTSNNPSLQLSDPLASFQYPNITCGSQNAAVLSDGLTMSPGNWQGAFPPAGVTTLQSGVYCLDTTNHGFTLSGGQVLTGDGVLIYMISGRVSWNSGEIHLSSPGDGYYKGLLLYLPARNPSNCSQVTINGNGASTFNGSILAPCSNVSLTGGSGGSGYNNQIVADTVTLSGNTDITINFLASQQWQPPTPPTIQLAQ
jgi:Flp pilus assembly protein TadG